MEFERLHLGWQALIEAVVTKLILYEHRGGLHENIA